MRYRLYQVIEDRIREVGFRSYQPNRPVQAADYHLTYQGEMPDEGSDTATLESLFYKFNMYHPEDFQSYSLSMADVVWLEDRAYYCDTVGWKRLDATAIVGEFA